ncbi:unnamed protein product [Echinostoma caproni]|uniref:BAH domain-containing protein n=1 Tax=Echinostoma caproni TaxID=27848 RepID=A0A3P8IUA2_9TREM|nr:unnamed protein product [Echinostoma caproni]
MNKTSTGAVEAKVVCFYRRRDLSLNLIQLADKHQNELSHPSDGTKPELLHQLRHREIFLSRHLETLPATHIRGKCTVTLHSDTEPCDVYLAKEDAFFFQLVYDPLQKTLQADRGQIREGPDYQADVPPYTPPDSADAGQYEVINCPEAGFVYRLYCLKCIWSGGHELQSPVEKTPLVIRSDPVAKVLLR